MTFHDRRRYVPWAVANRSQVFHLVRHLRMRTSDLKQELAQNLEDAWGVGCLLSQVQAVLSSASSQEKEDKFEAAFKIHDKRESNDI